MALEPGSWLGPCQHDVAPDGMRFLVNSLEAEGDAPITLVVDWTAGLGG